MAPPQTCSSRRGVYCRLALVSGEHPPALADSQCVHANTIKAARRTLLILASNSSPRNYEPMHDNLQGLNAPEANLSASCSVPDRAIPWMDPNPFDHLPSGSLAL